MTEVTQLSSIEELALDDPRLKWVGGGEVGATRMGDDYHYTGRESWDRCMVAEMSGRSGASGSFAYAFIRCTF